MLCLCILSLFFPFKKFYYLFIWLYRVLVAAFELLASAYVGSSSRTRDRTQTPALGAES